MRLQFLPEAELFRTRQTIWEVRVGRKRNNSAPVSALRLINYYVPGNFEQPGPVQFQTNRFRKSGFVFLRADVRPKVCLLREVIQIGMAENEPTKVLVKGKPRRSIEPVKGGFEKDFRTGEWPSSCHGHATPWELRQPIQM